MVMIWNSLAGGDPNLCAIIVIVNSVLQIVLYSPFALFFIKVISRSDAIPIKYGITAIAVLVVRSRLGRFPFGEPFDCCFRADGSAQFLGIPLALGLITRFTLLLTIGRDRFHRLFLPCFSPLALAGLLYTIIVIFAQQAKHILHNLGPVFRTIVPMVLYFATMFSSTFAGMWWWSNRSGRERVGYEEAAVQSFTAASNNFVRPYAGLEV